MAQDTTLNEHSLLSQRVGEEKASSAGGLGQEVFSPSFEQDGSIVCTDTIRQEDIDEQEWLNKVQLAYEQLRARGEPVTVKAICQTIPVSTPTLNRYPKISAFLESVILDRGYQTKRRKAQLHEEALVAEVHQAIDHLKIEGHSVTQAAIAELVHLTVQRLRGYPTVRVLLDQISAEEKHAKPKTRIEELLKQMREAIRILESQGQLVTQKAVEEIIHRDVSDLVYWYLQIKALWQEVQAKRSCQKKIQTKQREEQLLVQTQDAINLLRLEGKRITATAIAELVGMTVASMKHYPQVALLLDSVVQANRTRKSA